MKVLKANKQQKIALEGVYKNGSELRFSLDGSGNNIVGLEVLNDPDFTEIWDSLNNLSQIEYIPKE